MVDRDDNTNSWTRDDKKYVFDMLNSILLDVQYLKTSLQWMRGLAVLLVPFALSGVFSGIVMYSKTESLLNDFAAHKQQAQEQWDKLGSKDSDRFTKIMELENRVNSLERSRASDYAKRQDLIDPDIPQIRRSR